MNTRLTLALESGKKYLLVASTGGHLAQLVRFSEMNSISPESLWITFRSPQSESLLRDKRVLFVPYIRSRHVGAVLRTMVRVWPFVRAEQFDAAISTGAAIALAVLPLARLRRMRTVYVESVSRTDGPSFTGRWIARLRLAELFTQHARWSDARWKQHASVLSAFARAPRPRSAGTNSNPPKVFVTLGTIRPYRFDSLVNAVLATGLASENTVWQLGVTDRSDLPGTCVAMMTADEFVRVSSEADVVVTHAGVGTIIDLLERGIYPVVVPRRASRQEHVDDHQSQITRLVDRMLVAAALEVEEISAEALLAAASYRIKPVKAAEVADGSLSDGVA